MFANHPFIFAQERLAALVPSVPNLAGFNAVTPATSSVEINGVSLQFDTTGALVQLTDNQSGVTWASASNAVGCRVHSVLL